MRLFLMILCFCFAGLTWGEGVDDGFAREAAKRGAAAIRLYLDEVTVSKNTDPALWDVLKALDKLATTVPALPDGTTPGKVDAPVAVVPATKPTVALFRKALKTPNLQYDAATNKLSLGYDFKSVEQLKDWEFSEKPELKGGVLIPVGATGSMKARFAAAKASVLFAPSTVRGCVYTTTCGLYLSRKTSTELCIGKGSGEHQTATSYSIPGEIGWLNLAAAATLSSDPGKHISIVDGNYFSSKRVSLELDNQGRFSLIVGDASGKPLGKTLVSSEEKSFGGIILTGQNTGAGQLYKEVVITGTPDPAWVDALFDEQVTGKIKPTIKQK